MRSDLTERLRTWSKIDRKRLNIYGGGKKVTCQNERKKKEGGDDAWDICIGQATLTSIVQVQQDEYHNAYEMILATTWNGTMQYNGKRHNANTWHNKRNEHGARSKDI